MHQRNGIKILRLDENFYEECINKVLSKFKDVEGIHSIYKFGSISTPGISDVMGITNPCEKCLAVPSPETIDCSICSTFHFACDIFSIDKASIGCYYTSLFFFMSIIQAISCGLVAGQISENSIIAGVKHSVIMAVITFGAFNILVWTKIMVI